jgi:hypothetical protein
MLPRRKCKKLSATYLVPPTLPRRTVTIGPVTRSKHMCSYSPPALASRHSLPCYRVLAPISYPANPRGSSSIHSNISSARQPIRLPLSRKRRGNFPCLSSRQIVVRDKFVSCRTALSPRMPDVISLVVESFSSTYSLPHFAYYSSIIMNYRHSEVQSRPGAAQVRPPTLIRAWPSISFVFCLTAPVFPSGESSPSDERAQCSLGQLL